MRTAKPKSLLERDASQDLWVHTLSAIPVLTGRLLYLSTLRNPVTGRYEHHGLALHFGEDGADRAIRVSHRKTFQEWLALGLAEKVADLAEYIRTSGENAETVLRYWGSGDGWGSFVPTGALGAEKALFVSDLRNAVKILRQQFGDGELDRGA